MGRRQKDDESRAVLPGTPQEYSADELDTLARVTPEDIERAYNRARQVAQLWALIDAQPTEEGED